jgi:hypothetical protein
VVSPRTQAGIASFTIKRPGSDSWKPNELRIW